MMSQNSNTKMMDLNDENNRSICLSAMTLPNKRQLADDLSQKEKNMTLECWLQQYPNTVSYNG